MNGLEPIVLGVRKNVSGLVIFRYYLLVLHIFCCLNHGHVVHTKSVTD